MALDEHGTQLAQKQSIFYNIADLFPLTFPAYEAERRFLGGRV